eukprot:COSAG05_NODE_478_length_9434_cov_5.178897_12_plen_427_part_00
MGLDGGTFATRADILRRSSWKLAQADSSWSTRGGALNRGALNKTTETASEADLARIRWSTCALSGNELREPVVACGLGALYNRESVLEYLVGQLQFPYNNKEAIEKSFGHLKKISSVFPLELTWGEPEPDTSVAAGARAMISCPLIHLPADGRYPFVVLRPCNHVLSQRALRSVQDPQQQQQQTCPVCGEMYTVTITLNGTAEDVSTLRTALSARLAEEKKTKKQEKKRRRHEQQAQGEAQAQGADTGAAAADTRIGGGASAEGSNRTHHHSGSAPSAASSSSSSSSSLRRGSGSGSRNKKQRQLPGDVVMSSLNSTLRAEVAERLAWADFEKQRREQEEAEAAARKRVIDSQRNRSAGSLRGATQQAGAEAAAVAGKAVAAARDSSSRGHTRSRSSSSGGRKVGSQGATKHVNFGGKHRISDTGR